jgi:hypothetical protein
VSCMLYQHVTQRGKQNYNFGNLSRASSLSGTLKSIYPIWSTDTEFGLYLVVPHNRRFKRNKNSVLLDKSKGRISMKTAASSPVVCESNPSHGATQWRMAGRKQQRAKPPSSPRNRHIL